MTSLAPVEGSAEAVRAVAAACEATGRRLADTAADLVRLRDAAVWDGPAGEAFGARIETAPAVLERAADRFLGAAGPMRAHATALEEEQAHAQRAVVAHREAWDAYRMLEERAAALVAAGGAESDPTVLAVRGAQQDEMATVLHAEAVHAAALERLAASDARCAGVLGALADDDIGDSALYRALRQASSLGHGVGMLAALPTRVAPPLAAAGFVGEGVGTLADGVLLVGYDEGSVRDVGVAAGAWALGFGGQALRTGAKVRTVVGPDGVAVARTLGTQERILLGAGATARTRLQDARVRLMLAPPTAAGVAPSAPVVTGGAAARLRAAGVRVVRARVASAGRELRLVRAGGAQTVGLYTAGLGLHAAGKGLPRVVPTDRSPQEQGASGRGVR
ncbi:hypothetical protein [Arthrobacter sp. NEB 688]|uniref:hypothetical protein n=1 Tax=Arthrobacter sp. NEB 688 TaxID=904039 RepID=UPI001563B149|nr:hypothetical protein [Arthrobacter sp. NEB 688]QKE84441.1 hypothetical protein HL663_11165 [Arthrobacter sp. NEB 688]